MISQITPAGVRPASRARSTAASVWPVRSSTPPALGLQREHVARLDEVARRACRVDRDLDRVRAVVRGDAGRDALARLDRDGERGLERRLVLGRHQVEAELVAALRRQRQADQPAGLLGHEVDRLGRRRTAAAIMRSPSFSRSSSSQTTTILPGGCPRSPPRRSRTALSCSACSSRATSFSTYLASTSTSRLTVRPGRGRSKGRALERLGDQRDVEGVSSTRETVSETPSTAIDPFSTT